jgi:methylase of polypeptide subunit release factors
VRQVLAPGAWLLVEIGAAHGTAALSAAHKAGAVEVEIVPDLAARDRVLAARFS